jgi:hypothetical protein
MFLYQIKLKSVQVSKNAMLLKSEVLALVYTDSQSAWISPQPLDIAHPCQRTSPLLFWGAHVTYLASLLLILKQYVHYGTVLGGRQIVWVGKARDSVTTSACRKNTVSRTRSSDKMFIILIES